MHMLKNEMESHFFVGQIVVLCIENIDFQPIISYAVYCKKYYVSIIVEYLSQNQYIIGIILELIYCNKFFYFLDFCTEETSS